MDLSSAHGPFIFGSYALTIVVLLLLCWWVIREDRKVQQQLKKLISDEA